MATRKTSQTQQKAETPATHPFGAMPGAAAWASMIEAQNERFEQMLSEMERMEKERHERMLSSLDDMTQLIKSGVEYQTQLTSQWRQMSLDAARKSVELMTPSQG